MRGFDGFTQVKKLIELAEETGLAELEVTSGDESVRISMAVAKLTVGEAKMITPANPEPQSVVSGDSGGNKTLVPTPMAGTFYQRPIQRLRPLCRLEMRFSRPGALHCREYEDDATKSKPVWWHRQPRSWWPTDNPSARVIHCLNFRELAATAMAIAL